MAELNLDGSIPLRPCLVKGRIHYFHMWNNRQWVVDPSPMMGGTPGGQCSVVLAIVEDEHGQVHEVYPNEVRFTDREPETTVFKNFTICGLYEEGTCLGAKSRPTTTCHGDKNQCTLYHSSEGVME